MKVKQGRISFNQEKDYHQLHSSSNPKRTSYFQSSSNLSVRYACRNDPRPLNEKNFLFSCINEIVDCLNENGYTELMTIEILSNPSGKIFTKILLFLMKKFDPNFDFHKKLEEDISLLMKNLHYPFVPSKRNFYQQGNPQVWPLLLGCLKWVTELFCYDSQICRNPMSEGFQKIFSNKTIWKQLTIAYHVFLSGTEEYRKYFQIIWAIIKNKQNTQNVKRIKILIKFKIFKNQNRIVFFIIMLTRAIKKKVYKLKKIKFILLVFLTVGIGRLNKKKIGLNNKWPGKKCFIKNIIRKEIEISQIKSALKSSKKDSKNIFLGCKRLIRILNKLIKRLVFSIKLLKFIFLEKKFFLFKKKELELEYFFRVRVVGFSFFKKNEQKLFLTIFLKNFENSRVFSCLRIFFFFLKIYGYIFHKKFYLDLEYFENFFSNLREKPYFLHHSIFLESYEHLKKIKKKKKKLKKDFQLFFQFEENIKLIKKIFEKKFFKIIFLEKIILLKTSFNFSKIFRLIPFQIIQDLFLRIFHKNLKEKIVCNPIKNFI